MEENEEKAFLQILKKALLGYEIDAGEGKYLLTKLKKIVLLSAMGIDKNQLVNAYSENPIEEIMGDFLQLVFEKSKIILNRFSSDGRAVSIDGKVLSVEDLNLKRTIAKNRLFVDYRVRDIENLKRLLNSEIVDVPFSVALKPSKEGKTSKDAALLNLKAIQQKISTNYAIFELQEGDLLFYMSQNKLPQTNWSGIIRRILEKTIKIREKLLKTDKKACLHFAFLGPSSLAFGLGAALGCKEPFVFYQYQSGKYYAVLDYRTKNLRELKRVLRDTMDLEVQEFSRGREVVAIAFYAASHNPTGDVKRFIGEKADLIVVKLKKSQGAIEIGDWTNLVNQLYSLFNKVKQKGYVEKWIFLSMPTALAFGLGMAIETFESAVVFNLKDEDNDYFEVFRLKELIN